MGMIMALGLAPGRVLFPGLVEAAGAQQVFRLQRFPGLAPCDRLARQQQRFGEILAHQVQIMDHHHDGAFLAMPALDQRDQVADRLGVDGVERLVEQDEVGVLQQHAGKQRALQLAARQRVDRTLFEAAEADRHQRLADVIAIFLGVAAEQAASWPQAKRDQIDDAGGKGAVEFRLLRQVGGTHAGGADDLTGHRFQDADNAFHQRRFAGAVGADHGCQRALADGAVEMMDRRVAAVAKRQVAECQAGLGHVVPWGGEIRLLPAVDWICDVITLVNKPLGRNCGCRVNLLCTDVIRRWPKRI